MNLLLDVNIVVDLCSISEKYSEEAASVIKKAQENGDKLWLYSGAVQTMEYVLAKELSRKFSGSSFNESRKKAREKIELLASACQWLSALAEDGDVFSDHDPEDAQFYQAVQRLGKDAGLVTRDRQLLTKGPYAITPQEYLASSLGEKDIAFIDLAAQQDVIRPQLEHNIHKVLHHGRYILGPEVKELEEKLAGFVGAKHCIGVSSGTDAILMPLMAKDIGQGDLVFTSPFTFIATAEVISLLGATPVFVDIDERTFNLDPGKLKSAIEAARTGDTSVYPLPAKVAEHPEQYTPKAIIPVDLFGLPSDYDPINDIAEKNGLFVLADSAQALGGEYKGRRVGTLAYATTTSFFPAKPLGGYGDGGAVFTDDDDLAERLRSIRVHGKGKDKYDNVQIGLNARLDTLQAAILLAKLEIFPDEIKKRQRVAEWYTKGLSASDKLTPPLVPEGLQSVWAQYSVLSANRSVIQDHLRKAGIPTAVYYARPLHLQHAFKKLGYQTGDMPVSEDASQCIFSLPMHPYFENGKIDRIMEIIDISLK